MMTALTARLYYRTIVGGAAIERSLREGEALLRDPKVRQERAADRLRALLRTATESVPFYQRLRRAGLDPESLRPPEDLSRLPVITREAMRETPEDYRASPLPPGSTVSQTGGSSGTPLQFWHDPTHRARMRVDLYRGYRWCGHQPGDRTLFLWGSDHDARAHQTALGRMLDLCGYNRQWINAFSFGPREMEAAIATCRSWQPQFLIAYTTSAWLLARGVQASGRSLPGLRAVQVTAELLTPSVRDTLQAAFAAPVFNRYGCREVGNIAHECTAHAGLHVFEDSHVVEVVDESGEAVPPGRPGRIVVTNLTNRATPFIRYDLGDIGRLQSEPCECGRSTPRLSLSEGRVGEIVTSPGGKWIHGEFFTHLFYKVEGIRRFRVLQDDLHTLRIQIESDVPPDAATLEFLGNAIHSAGDPAFRITFEHLQTIPPSPSGKHRFIESRVPIRVRG